jgi:hypothetical protein
VKIILFILVASLVLAVPTQAELLINGDFETGN